MKSLLLTALSAAVCLIPVGCGNKSPEGGQPGTKDTFVIVGPTSTLKEMTAPTIKQGTVQTIELKIKAESAFSGKTIALTADAPTGVHVEPKPASVDVKAGQEVKFSLEVRADKDAPTGPVTVKVTGTPEKGSPTTESMKVNVEAVNEPANHNTFGISLPTSLNLISKKIKQGASETVELTLKAESGFTGGQVAVKTEQPAKLKVEAKPASLKLAAGMEAKVQLVITPAKDCPKGEHTVRVTATPGTGSPEAKEFKVTVE